MTALAVQLFDREGYYATVIAGSDADVRAAVDRRTARAPSCVACSVPFDIVQERGKAPDVSMPGAFRAELAGLGVGGAP